MYSSEQSWTRRSEELAIEYAGDELEIAFNVQYLLDVLGVLEGTNTKLILSDSNASILVQETDSQDAVYVVMPMRLWCCESLR